MKHVAVWKRLKERRRRVAANRAKEHMLNQQRGNLKEDKSRRSNGDDDESRSKEADHLDDDQLLIFWDGDGSETSSRSVSGSDREELASGQSHDFLGDELG